MGNGDLEFYSQHALQANSAAYYSTYTTEKGGGQVFRKRFFLSHIVSAA
jgi:hypothetical protein